MSNGGVRQKKSEARKGRKVRKGLIWIVTKTLFAP